MQVDSVDLISGIGRRGVRGGPAALDQRTPGPRRCFTNHIDRRKASAGQSGRRSSGRAFAGGVRSPGIGGARSIESGGFHERAQSGVGTAGNPAAEKHDRDGRCHLLSARRLRKNHHRRRGLSLPRQGEPAGTASPDRSQFWLGRAFFPPTFGENVRKRGEPPSPPPRDTVAWSGEH